MAPPIRSRRETAGTGKWVAVIVVSHAAALQVRHVASDADKGGLVGLRMRNPKRWDFERQAVLLSDQVALPGRIDARPDLGQRQLTRAILA